MSRFQGEKFAFIGTSSDVNGEFLLISSAFLIFINYDFNIDFAIPNLGLP